MSERKSAASPTDVARQLREAADRLVSATMAAAGSMTAPLGLPTPSRLPALPASMSAEKVQAVLDDLAERRAQVQALRDSLTVFDGQLEALEAGLRPMLEWTRAWAELEKSIAGLWPLPGGKAK